MLWTDSNTKQLLPRGCRTSMQACTVGICITLCWFFSCSDGSLKAAKVCSFYCFWPKCNRNLFLLHILALNCWLLYFYTNRDKISWSVFFLSFIVVFQNFRNKSPLAHQDTYMYDSSNSYSKHLFVYLFFQIFIQLFIYLFVVY